MSLLLVSLNWMPGTSSLLAPWIHLPAWKRSAPPSVGRAPDDHHLACSRFFRQKFQSSHGAPVSFLDPEIGAVASLCPSGTIIGGHWNLSCKMALLPVGSHQPNPFAKFREPLQGIPSGGPRLLAIGPP